MTLYMSSAISLFSCLLSLSFIRLLFFFLVPLLPENFYRDNLLNIVSCRLSIVADVCESDL